MKHNLLISNRIFSTIFFAVLMLCATNAWGADFTVNSSTTSSDALFSVSETMTNYTYSTYWTSSDKLIEMATSTSITVTNVTGATITGIRVEGVADNNSNKTVNFTGSDGTTSAATSSGSWNNRKSSSLTSKALNSTNVNKFKCDAGQTYTLTNNASSSYNAGVRFVITYTSTLPTSLTNGATTSSTQALSWTAPSTAPANGYLVAYSSSTSTAPANSVTSTTGNYTVVAISAGTTSTTLSELSTSTTYNWWVRSKNARGNSSWVAGSSFTTTGAACTDPTAAWSTAPANGTEGGSMNASLTTNYAAGVVYSSSNTDVATVSGNGTTTCTISYVGVGSTRITATVTGDGSTICAGPATCYTDITVSVSNTRTVYLNPKEYSDWYKGDERYAIYCYGSGDAWYDFTSFDAGCEGTLYRATVDKKYTGYVICRMNGGTTGNTWGNVWDQTYDITAADGIYCKITGMSGGKANFTYNFTPWNVCVSGEWLRFTGETIILTATAAGASNYQWYKGGTAEGNKITGATSATYTKASCTTADAGNYYCKAWNVAGQEKTSDAFGLKIPKLTIQTPPASGQPPTDRLDIPFVRANESDAYAECDQYRGVAWNYEFVVDDGFDTYGNSGTMQSDNCSNWPMDKVNSNWCKIHTTKEGTYRFYLDFNKVTYTPLSLSVVYPPMKQTGGLKVYIENTPEMQGRGWSNSSIYYRIGKGKYDKGDTRNWTAAQQMTLVPGTARYLETTTPDWADNFWVWHIANNRGDVEYSRSSIYRTYSDDGYTITESSNFHGDEITSDRTIILNSSSGGYGQDGMNNNCKFYGYTHTPGMILHNASVAATTNGKIKIEWTDVNNVAQTNNLATARTISNLAHTCILRITGVPDCGYQVATLKVNGVDLTSGTTHILDADATITATFTDATHTINYVLDGGTINSGNVTSYVHGTGATLPTDVTKDGKTFGGWYDNSGFTGSPVSSISTTDCGDKTFYAMWTTCPALCSGETLYKFEVNSSVGDGNICSSGNNPQELTTPTQLSVLTGGSLEGYITNNSNWNNLTFTSGRITYVNNDRGVLILTLNCPIREGDLIRFNNYSSSNSRYNYLRHTSNSTSTGQLTLNASRSETEIQQIIAPAAFDGKTELFIVPGSRTTGISYFEIIRPFKVTLDAAANGGTVDGNGTKELLAANADVIALTHAKKDGYRFKGWYAAPSGGSPVSDAYTVTECITLYAQFEDCPDRGTLYKFEAKTGLTNGSVTANNVAFDFNTANYLSTLIGGTLITDGSAASKVEIANTNAFSIKDNSAYLRIDLDCELEEGDIFKSTVNGATVFVSKATTRTSTAVLPIGTLSEQNIPAALVGEKTLYLWKGSGNANAISYFEITRPSQTVITLDATGANNHYTTSVIAKYGSEMPEIAVLPTRVGYVFQGYYDGAGGTGTQYYSATGESMLNWDKDVSSYTLYAKWETPCEIAPTLTNVAPVVTIWDQHPVDISLVKLSCPFDTTGILHYSLASVSPADPITGCEFKYFDDYIHIMGTPTLYNTSVVTVDITFTITNDCSPAVTATITQTIQIYPKDQKARIAFIITGAEGGAFNAYDAGNASSCNTLVTYLREFYTVDYVNGYASKDPVALATYYDDYDLLVVTDYLETNKGYTNAIGTLIDKKPILSFEAYVAKESNWHIGSNPNDPSPKVQDMKVLCAGHAIFSDDSYYGTPVDVVNTDTIVHVLDALSTEDDAKGLQGFVINEAPDFIFLATIKDANNKRDLVVCCERQVVFPARLLLFGINFYEMPNLSSAGQIIIRQMIDYLLMTDETKVADCSLVFDNNDGDHLWSNPLNWAPGYNIIPTPYHPTRIIAECHVNVDDAHAGSVKVNKGRDEHGKPVDGKLIIKPYGGLTVAGMVAKVNDTRYASPITIKAEDLLIEADETHNGGFVYGNKESDVRATVQYYSRGEGAYTTPVWQYMGIPFQANQTAIQMYYAAWMCRWSSATTDGLGGLWQWVDNEDVLLPFEGYAITQENKKTYEFAGKLNPPVTTTIDLDNRDTEGFAFAANSWTAPIKIQEMADEDFVNAEKAIYIYHSGSYADWTANGTPVSAKTGAAATLPGQYQVVPIHSSPYLTGADSVIPAMQGFFVQTSSADAKLKLVYNKVVYDGSYFKTSTQPMRAPRRSNNGGVEKMQLMVCGANYGGDQVHLLARGDFSEGYEDGWDGRKLEGDTAFVPYLAVVKEAGNMSVAAINSLDDRFLSFRAGKDTEYTFSFNYEGETIYLYDIVTQQVTEIRTGNTYSFTATNKSPLERFLITTHPPRITTDIESITGDGLPVTGVKKFIYEGKIYILSDGIVYDAIGQRVDIGKEVAQ